MMVPLWLAFQTLWCPYQVHHFPSTHSQAKCTEEATEQKRQADKEQIQIRQTLEQVSQDKPNQHLLLLQTL
jgi:hypothetical protein